jgi:hypothetical protein
MVLDPNKAIQFGQLVQAAYAVPPSSTVNGAGTTISAAYDPFGMNYKVVTSVFGSDLKTDINPARGSDTVSFGFVLQATNGDVVICIRGTEGIWEWINDAEFLYVKCPFLAGAGYTEDGFTAIYNTLRIDVAPGAPKLVDALATLPFAKPPSSVTICGHSLGGALATLLALDVAANSEYSDPNVYTYASPRTGDPLFVSTYNQVVPNTIRAANRVDIVPKLPLPPMYEHVLGLADLNPVKFGPLPTLPQVLVNFSISCEHSLNTYLYLLSLLPGATMPQPLDAACAP